MTNKIATQAEIEANSILVYCGISNDTGQDIYGYADRNSWLKDLKGIKNLVESGINPQMDIRAVAQDHEKYSVKENAATTAHFEKKLNKLIDMVDS